MSQKKKVALGVLLGAAVFAAVFAVAATLGINSDTLGAGSSPVEACTEGDVTTSYTTSWGGTEFVVDSVEVDAGEDCADMDFSVHLEGQTATGTLDGDGVGTAEFSTEPSAEDTEAIYVTITG